MEENVQYQISGDGTYFDTAIGNLLYGEIPVMYSCGDKKIKIGSSDWIKIENNTPSAYYATIRTTGLYYTGKYSTPVFYVLEDGAYKYVEADVRYSDDRKYITVYSNTNSDLYFTFVSSCKDWRSEIATKDMLYYRLVHNDDGTDSYAVGVRNDFKGIISEITSDDILKTYNETSVTKIDESGFSECPVLKSIAIPDSITSIADSAFKNCARLQRIDILGTVNYIGASAFEGCGGLTAVKIPSGVEEINARSFKGTGIVNLTIPKSVKTVGLSAFEGCGGMEKLIFEDESQCSMIGPSAFYSCYNLEELTIPTSVTQIGQSAFAYCKSFTSLTIPTSVKSIGNNAFEVCLGLKDVRIDGDSLSIGTSAFSGCTGMESVTFGSGVASIGASAFFNCKKLSNVVIPENVQNIGLGAFRGCFGDIGTNRITLPFVGATKDGTDNTHFGYIFGARSYSDNNGAVPSRLSTVEVNRSDSYSIASNSFYECSSIETIKLLGSPSSFGSDAFKYCTGLGSVYIDNLVAWCAATFEPVFNTGLNVQTVYSNPLYKGSDKNYNYKSRDLYINDEKVETLEIDGSAIPIIKAFAFCGCTMTKLQINSNVIIEKYAFAWCEKLSEADVRWCSFGDRVYNGNPVDQSRMFVDCSSLRSITINYQSKKIPTGFASADNIVGCLEEVNLYQFVGANQVASFDANEADTSPLKSFCCQYYSRGEMRVVIDGVVSMFTKNQGSSTSETDLFHGTWNNGEESLQFENNNKVSYKVGDSSGRAVEYVVSDGLRTSLLSCTNELRREIDESSIRLTEIEPFAFKNHAADAVYVPSSVTSIGTASLGASPSISYNSPQAQSITINPDGYDLTIGESAFRFFYNTTRLYIPRRVKYIGTGAFFELGFGVYMKDPPNPKPQDNRCWVYIYRPYTDQTNNITEAAEDAFGDPEATRGDGSYYDHWKAFQLFVPSNSLLKYQSADYWNEYVGDRYMLSTVNSLGVVEDVPLLTGFDPNPTTT